MRGIITYESYKDSGIEWVGIIPSNWNITSVGRVYDIVLGKMLQPLQSNSADELVSYLKAMNVQDGYLKVDTIDQMFASKSEIDNLLILSGDLLVCEGGDVARSVVIREDLDKFIFQNSLHRVRSSRNNVAFLHYYLIALRNSGFVDILVNKATIAHFTKDKFSSLKFCIPSVVEQNKIVNFLNKQTKKMEYLIKTKDRLITLLEEKRQAMITEKVTKGLNTNIRMKDSGVAWIGEIPEHWKISKIKYQSFINKNTLNDKTEDSMRIKYIDIGGVNAKGEIEHIENYIFSEAPSRARRIVHKGDTIISTVRTYLKAIASIEKEVENLICSTGFAVLTSKTTINEKYLAYLIKTTNYVDEIVSRSVGVSYPAINSSDIGDLECILPSLQEQEQIVHSLEGDLYKLDQVVLSIQKQIQKLKEYRQSIIYEAVTGKIDVRDFEVEQ